jgi:hypothetical protein
MSENYDLFPGLRETPQTPEKHALPGRASRSKKRERLGWRNLDPEIETAGRVGPFRFWLAPATVKGIPMMVLELYCANDDCNYGPINIVERRLGRRYPEPGQPQKCPGCGEPAKLQWRVTGDEYREQCRALFDIAATAVDEK